MSKMFKLSVSPHIRDNTDVQKIMHSVILALLPAAAGAVYFFGLRALWIIVLSVVSCIATEGLIGKMLGKPLTIFDGSAIVTGILLAFNLPVGVPWWIPVAGCVFAIAVGKMTFGGLGYNPMNPALLGRVFLLISWPIQMTTWHKPTGFSGLDAETVATPLAILKENSKIIINRDGSTIEAFNSATSKIAELSDSYMDLFVGDVSGCLGETSVLLLLVGAAFLMYKQYIGWKIPFSYIATVGLFTWIFGGYEGLFSGPWLFHIISGGLILGAFFMATDMVTSPITFRGRIIFGVGCGIITSIIRLWGGYPEGVSFSILLMNITVPLIDRYTRPKIFGKVK
ncbi:RnfABCDGE type electron transport complex subunit D [Candidatus Latescibacterota bacterium]